VVVVVVVFACSVGTSTDVDACRAVVAFVIAAMAVSLGLLVTAAPTSTFKISKSSKLKSRDLPGVMKVGMASEKSN